MKDVIDAVLYVLLRGLLLPIRFCSYRTIARLGWCLGSCFYYLSPYYRKRVLSNLAIASKLNLSLEERKRVARGSFASLATTMLEYFRLPYSHDNLDEVLFVENPELLEKVRAEGKGVVLFCGHQANWEVGILGVSHKDPATAVGLNINNRYFHLWVNNMREMFHARIVAPSDAMREGLKALRRGECLGVVGDQSVTNSSYSSAFLGAKAYTGTAAAVLAYKAQSPIITGRIVRHKDRYTLRYSDPVYPDTSQPIRGEVHRLMKAILDEQERIITAHPEQWFWVHNRWKRGGAHQVKRRYRHYRILVAFPLQGTSSKEVEEVLYSLQMLYERADFTFLVPSGLTLPEHEQLQTIKVTKKEDYFLDDWTQQQLINLTTFKELKQHYLRLGTFEVIDVVAQKQQQETYTEFFTRLFCR